MIDVALLSASQRRFFPPPARRSRKATASHGRQSLSKRRLHARPSLDPPQKSSSSSLPPRTLPATGARSPTSASSATPKPHRSRQPNQPPTSPRFPPWEAFERRPHNPHHRLVRGRRPKPFTDAGIDHGAGRTSRREDCDHSKPPLGTAGVRTHERRTGKIDRASVRAHHRHCHSVSPLSVLLDV